MVISTKELRNQLGRVIEHATQAGDVVVTYRGKPVARIVPIDTGEDAALTDELHGMWADRTDLKPVDEWLREARKGRTF